MDSRATTIWVGGLQDGSGTATFESSGTATLPVSWPSRTEAPNGQSSPEEMIAAAHSSCYCMALSAALGKAGSAPQRLETTAVVTFVPGKGITTSALTVRGWVEGMSEEDFVQHAEGAKVGCPVSGALKGNVEITLDAALGETKG